MRKVALAVVISLFTGLFNFGLGSAAGFGADMDNIPIKGLLAFSVVLLILPTIAGTRAAAILLPRYSILWAAIVALPIFLGFTLGQLPSTSTAGQLLAVGGLPLLAGLLTALRMISKSRGAVVEAVPSAATHSA